MSTIRSFDVFDTCLTRRVAVPSALFYDVGRRAFKLLGIPLARTSLVDFVAARIQAEHLAREQSGQEEVSLREIWECLTLSMEWILEDSLLACELDAEAESLFPVGNVQQMILQARQAGDRIVFTSDTYLPREFVALQLGRHGMLEAGDGLYISSEVRLTKSSGNLFRYLLNEEAVLASDVIHLGDNAINDVHNAQICGIRGTLFSGTKLTPTEAGVLACRMDQSEALLRFCGAMRAGRLETGPQF